MAQILLAVGGAIFLVLGTLHGVLTLRDVGTPRAFTPTDEAVRLAMQGARLAFNPRAPISGRRGLASISVTALASCSSVEACYIWLGNTFLSLQRVNSCRASRSASLRRISFCLSGSGSGGLLPGLAFRFYAFLAQ